MNQVRKLWKICFAESDEYLDLYFNKRYKSEYTLNISKDNNVISSAQFVPYRLSYCGEILKHAYILGVCTHPDHRKKGYAAEILNLGMLEHYKNDFAVVSLIPQEEYLFALYKKFDFAPFFNTVEFEVSKAHFSENPKYEVFEYTDTPSNFNELYKFCDNWYSQLDIGILKTKEDFRFAIDELILFKSKILIAPNKGMAVLVLKEQKDDLYTIKEILYNNSEAQYSILYYIFQNYNISKKYSIPSILAKDKKNKKSMGMARILNPLKLLKILAMKSSHLNLSFRLTDPLINENNGIYKITNSEVLFFEDVDYNCDFELDIYSLGKLMFGCNTGEHGSVFPRLESYANLLLN